MMLRNSVIFITVVVCLAALALTAVRHRELASLSEQEQQLRTQAKVVISSAPQIKPSEAVKITTEQHSPSIELLRLRGEIGQLERRKRELAGARTENESLRNQLATRGTNASTGIALPPGYLRKTQAKFVGYNTPEDTLQSLLWAIQNRDKAGFLQAFDAEPAEEYAARMETPAALDEFFKASVLPGMQIVGKELGTAADNEVVLMVQIMPGQEPERLGFKQAGGQWKLVSGY
jgi:hypothetical protein